MHSASKMLQRLNFKLLKVQRVIEAVPCSWLRDKPPVVEERPIVPIKMAYTSYESTGFDSDPTPLIVMHGLFGSKGNWNSLCKAFQKNLNCKVFSVDARNHGDSPHSPEHSYQHIAADIHAFMKDFNITKANLIGHSMGGRGVMYFSLKYPELVDKMVVVDVSPIKNSSSLSAMPPLFEFMAKVHMPKGGTIAQAKTMVERQLATKINDRALRAFLVTNLVQKSDGTHAWRINLSALLNNYRKHIINFPVVNNLKFPGPTLFVGGEKSDHIAKNSLPELQKLFPLAVLKFIPNAGHWLHSEQSTTFLQVSTEFLKTARAEEAAVDKEKKNFQGIPEGVS